MASTYSDLKIELIGTGEQVGTWGATTNTNLGTALEEAIVGSANVAFSSADVTLTLTNTNGTQAARHVRLNLTGTSGGARNLILGSGCQIDKPYIINNGLADTVTVKNTTGTGVAVPAGKTMWVFNNGTNVVEAMNHAASLTLGTALPAASGGTGLTSPGTSGNILTSNGTAWTSSTPAPTFVAGMIMLWSGSIASVPSGWALCDGTNGTPNLRDRFVVGAGTTYAVNATGGASTVTLAETNLPSHTHSISATGTSGSSSVDHTHTFSGTTASAGSHTHSITDPGHSHALDNLVKAVNNSQIGRSDASQSTTITSTSSATTGISINSAGSHDHTYSGTTSSPTSTSHTHSLSVTGTSGATGSGTSFSILNPYYALAYIMKL
jgi:microcystin-dependent protein